MFFVEIEFSVTGASIIFCLACSWNAQKAADLAENENSSSCVALR